MSEVRQFRLGLDSEEEFISSASFFSCECIDGWNFRSVDLVERGECLDLKVGITDYLPVLLGELYIRSGLRLKMCVSACS